MAMVADIFTQSPPSPSHHKKVSYGPVLWILLSPNKEYRCLVIHQLDRKLMIATFSKIYGKIRVDFCFKDTHREKAP